MECPFCHKMYKSYKSWHRHKTLSHNGMIGVNRDRLEYEKNLKKCKHCEMVLDFTARKQNFCSVSCSASFNNKLRTPESRLKQAHTLRSHYNCPIKVLVRDRVQICQTCNSEFKSKKQLKFCSPMCNTGKFAKIHYRILCRFNLNPKDHKDLYDFKSVAKVGMYRASNHPQGYNPDGMTWDHLFRVEDGFRQKVPPEIMSHPANAEMVSWRENQKRKTSRITLEELKQRINSSTE